MKISRIIIENFRIFRGKYIFDFSNKQAILIDGPNGHGKSSIFDAIQWCITGDIKRYKGSSEHQKFNYIIHESEVEKTKSEVTVELWLSTNNGSIHKIVRNLRKNKSTTKHEVIVDESKYNIKDGTQQIQKILLSRLNSYEDNIDLSTFLTTTQILPQAELQDFIYATKPEERFRVMEKVLGLKKYGVDFRDYLIECSNLVKVEIDQLEKIKEPIEMKLIQVSTRVEEKENLSQNIGSISQEEILEEIRVVLSELRLQGMDSSFVVEDTQVNQELYGELVNLRKSRESIKDKLIRIRKKLQNAEKKFIWSNVEHEKEIESHTTEINTIKKRIDTRVKGIETANKYEEDINAVEKLRLSYNETCNKYTEVEAKIKELDNKKDGILKNDLIVSLNSKYLNNEEFSNDYINCESQYEVFRKLVKLNEYDVEIKNCSAVLKQLNNNILLIEENLKVINQDLAEIKKKIKEFADKEKVHKSNTVQQFIYQVQMHLLENGDQTICPICGTDYDVHPSLHKAVKCKWEEANNKLSELEQEMQQFTSLETSTLEIIKQRMLEVDFHKDDVIKTSEKLERTMLEREKLASSLNIEDSSLYQLALDELMKHQERCQLFIEDNKMAFELLKVVDSIKVERETLIQSIKLHEEGLKQIRILSGRWNRYLDSNELAVLSKRRLVTSYKLKAMDCLKDLKQRLQLSTSRLDELHSKSENRRNSLLEVQKEIPEFTGEINELNEWIKYYDSKIVEFNMADAVLESILEKINVFLTKGDLSSFIKEKDQLKKDVKEKNDKIKQYSSIEQEINDLKKQHNKIQSQLMSDYLTSYSELIDHLFTQISPHAFFRHVHLVPRDGRLYIIMSEKSIKEEKISTMDEGDLSKCFNASLTFSAAQTNILAVCIFLALNMSQKWTPLQMIGIDDPFQCLDDVNIYSFVDVLSQIAVNKQLIISTHSEEFSNLVAAKLAREGNDIGYIKFRSYDRDLVDIDSNCLVKRLEK